MYVPLRSWMDDTLPSMGQDGAALARTAAAPEAGHCGVSPVRRTWWRHVQGRKGHVHKLVVRWM